jgi:hypothetical protein
VVFGEVFDLKGMCYDLAILFLYILKNKAFVHITEQFIELSLRLLDPGGHPLRVLLVPLSKHLRTDRVPKRQLLQLRLGQLVHLLQYTALIRKRAIMNFLLFEDRFPVCREPILYKRDNLGLIGVDFEDLQDQGLEDGVQHGANIGVVRLVFHKL